MTLFEFLQSLTPAKVWAIGCGLGLVLILAIIAFRVTRADPETDKADVIDINDPTYDMDHRYHWKDYTDL